MTSSLRAKLFLLAVVSILTIIKESWPEAQCPNRDVEAWEPADARFPKHPNQGWKEYLKQRWLRPPNNDIEDNS